jgi:phosphatidylglycerophosphate synthase
LREYADPSLTASYIGNCVSVLVAFLLHMYSEIITALLFSASLTLILLIKYIAVFGAYRKEGVSLPAALERIENGAKATGGLTRGFVFSTIVFTFILYTLHS